jgi:hypothetical protein
MTTIGSMAERPAYHKNSVAVDLNKVSAKFRDTGMILCLTRPKKMAHSSSKKVFLLLGTIKELSAFKFLEWKIEFIQKKIRFRKLRTAKKIAGLPSFGDTAMSRG